MDLEKAASAVVTILLKIHYPIQHFWNAVLQAVYKNPIKNWKEKNSSDLRKAALAHALHWNSMRPFLSNHIQNKTQNSEEKKKKTQGVASFQTSVQK